MNKPAIVLVGYAATGKEEARKILTKKSFVSHSGGDVLRAIALALGEPPDRDTLIELGNLVRKWRGSDILMHRARTLAEEIADDSRYRGLVVDSLRNPAEVQYLKRETHATVVELITSSPEVRLARMIERNKLGDPTTLEGLRALDDIDHGIGQEAFGQNIAGCVALSDTSIVNEGTRRDLELSIDNLLASRDILEGGMRGRELR